VVEDFHEKSDVVFGDVTLSKSQVRTIHGTEQSPGAGGWPTIRHFNTATGYGGAAYVQKTSKAMCDELGPSEEYMQNLVEEASGASMCDVKDTSSGCSDQQSTFIGKWTGKPKDELQKQLDRLKGMAAKDGSSMKAEALKWVKQRAGIIGQLIGSNKQEL